MVLMILQDSRLCIHFRQFNKRRDPLFPRVTHFLTMHLTVYVMSIKITLIQMLSRVHRTYNWNHRLN